MCIIHAALKIDSLTKVERDQVFEMCDESTLRKNGLLEKFKENNGKRQGENSV